MVSGLLLLSAGQAIRVFIDIAVQTAPIGDIAANTAKTVAFFERMSGTQPEPAAPPTYAEAVWEGYTWRQYSDGHVEAYIENEWKRFDNSAEFGRYIAARKHRPR